MEEEIPKKIEKWETYKILNKIRENIHEKKNVAKDAFVFSFFFTKRKNIFLNLTIFSFIF